MELYIHGSGIISPAGNNQQSGFLQQAPNYKANHLLCPEPDYTGIIPPAQLRRMSKVVRMGVAAAKTAQQQSGIEKPDALSVGTAYGCLADTELFLDKLVGQNEQMLSPTAFIQSTHNTVSGQIALLAGCHGHNLTFSHQGHSFEHAVINAQLYLNDHPEEKILIGGIDELTPTSLDLLQQSKVLSKEAATPTDIMHGAQGAIGGEGAAFFMCSATPAPGTVCIRAVTTFTTANEEDALQQVRYFLQREQIPKEELDVVIMGISGDERTVPFYDGLKTAVFKDNSQAMFKHLSGEYPTSSAFALGIAMQCVKTGVVPEFALLNDAPAQLKKILLINHHIHAYSIWYLDVV